MRTKLIGSIALLSIFALAGCGSSSNSASDQLSSLTISAGTLSPTFASGKADYTVSVDNSATAVTVTPTAKDSGATIKVNDVAVNSGEASGSIDLAVGTNTITIDVTAKGARTANTYTITVTRAAPSDEYIGSQCQCTGTDCKKAGFYPFPPGTPGGIITGCENVKPVIPTGAELLCLKSYDGTALGLPSTYFANGYCSVGALKCTPNDTSTLSQYICTMAQFTNSNLDQVETCPAGSVMIADTRTVSFAGGSATVENKVCAKSCTQPSECRTGETDVDLDPNNPPPTQYTCSDFNSSDKCNGNNLKFCFDPRTLTQNCKVTPNP